MTDRVSWIPDDVWAEIVAHVPVPSVDLVIDCTDGVLLARRQNEPAKGEWFVPRVRIEKGEPIREAVHRIAHEELSIDVTIKSQLGAYDHLYQTSDIDDGVGKHYIAHGYYVAPDSEVIKLDDQHDDSAVFQPEQLPGLHPYVRSYLIDAGIIEA